MNRHSKIIGLVLSSLMITCSEAKPFHEIHTYASSSSSVSNNTVGDIVVRLVSVFVLIAIAFFFIRFVIIFSKLPDDRYRRR